MDHLINDKTVSLLLTSSNQKYNLIVVMLRDTGLRITELVSLKIDNIDFKENIISVKSLKKRSEIPIYRKIPMTDRVIDHLNKYLINRKIKKGYLFPTNSKSGHISRIRVWRYLRKYGGVSPHKFRHTYATNIVEATNDIRLAQKLLGHSSSNTTEIYLHKSQEQLEKAVYKLQTSTLIKKILYHLKQRKKFTINPNIDNTAYIPRNINIPENQNVIIIGPKGCGKSSVLKKIYPDAIRLSDIRGGKKIFNPIFNKLNLNKNILNQTVSCIIEFLESNIQKKAEILIIDNIDNLTITTIRILERLSKLFNVITSAIELPQKFKAYFESYNVISLPNLSTSETQILLNHYDVKDPEIQMHLHRTTKGNPALIFDLLSKNPNIDRTFFRNIRPEITEELDFSFLLVIILGVLTLLKYVAVEIDADSGAYRLIGAVCILVLMLSRKKIF